MATIFPPDEYLIRGLDRVVLFAHRQGLPREHVIYGGAVVMFAAFMNYVMVNQMFMRGFAGGVFGAALVFMGLSGLVLAWGANRAAKSRLFNHAQAMARDPSNWQAWSRCGLTFFIMAVAVTGFENIPYVIQQVAMGAFFLLLRTYKPEEPLGKFHLWGPRLAPQGT
jgi:hypothetical protein